MSCASISWFENSIPARELNHLDKLEPESASDRFVIHEQCSGGQHSRRPLRSLLVDASGSPRLSKEICLLLRGGDHDAHPLIGPWHGHEGVVVGHVHWHRHGAVRVGGAVVEGSLAAAEKISHSISMI